MRLVSLCPSLTELVFDLGAGDELVGITRYCVHPAERVGAVETVGGTKDPDVARIVALAPDLVLMNEEENRAEDHDDLRRAGVAILNTFPKDARETAAMVREIGVALGRGEAAERIAGDIEARVADAEREARGARPVRFAYLVWKKPWMSVSGDTFASALLELAGGVNVFADAPVRYPQVTLDELRAGAPDLVLLCTEPYAFTERDAQELADELGLDPARVRVADGEYLSWHGSRTPDGVSYAAELVRAARAL